MRDFINRGLMKCVRIKRLCWLRTDGKGLRFNIRIYPNLSKSFISFPSKDEYKFNQNIFFELKYKTKIFFDDNEKMKLF